MTIEDVRRNPVKVKVHVNGHHNVEGLLVVGRDDRLYLLHDGTGPHGDPAGAITEQLGYRDSWCMGSYSPFELEKLAWTLVSHSLSPGVVDMSFKKLKRFSL